MSFDIETRMWAHPNTGIKVHAFLNGVALCRKTITVSEMRTLRDWSEVQTWGTACTACETRFNAAIERYENSMRPSTGEGDYLPPAKPAQEVEKMSPTMHDELLYAANRYQNGAGVVAYCPRRTEDALIRRGMITYDTNRPDNYPVITVKGWEYLRASVGFNRRAEDPGRLTLEEALEEAYPVESKTHHYNALGGQRFIEGRGWVNRCKECDAPEGEGNHFHNPRQTPNLLDPDQVESIVTSLRKAAKAMEDELVRIQFNRQKKEHSMSEDLSAQMAAEAAKAEAERLAAEARAEQALRDAQAALNQAGVSIPPGAWGH